MHEFDDIIVGVDRQFPRFRFKILIVVVVAIVNISYPSPLSFLLSIFSVMRAWSGFRLQFLCQIVVALLREKVTHVYCHQKCVSSPHSFCVDLDIRLTFVRRP